MFSRIQDFSTLRALGQSWRSLNHFRPALFCFFFSCLFVKRKREQASSCTGSAECVRFSLFFIISCVTLTTACFDDWTYDKRVESLCSLCAHDDIFPLKSWACPARKINRISFVVPSFFFCFCFCFVHIFLFFCWRLSDMKTWSCDSLRGHARRKSSSVSF